MLRVTTLSGLLLLVSCVPGSLGQSFVASPGVVRGNITGSVALEWTLQSEPGGDDLVGFAFNDDDVFRYIPYTGVIPPPNKSGLGSNLSARYDPRFSIHNTSTRGVGFRLAGLRPEDAGNYTCRYASLIFSITVDAIIFAYDVPDKPKISVRRHRQGEVPGAILWCVATSTSLPAAERPAMLYTWSRNRVEIDRIGPPDRHVVLDDSGQFLNISPLHHTDTTYTCTASENGTQLTSEETEITLDVRYRPYDLKINPGKPSARENEAWEITASADCNPVCNYTWSIGDDVISQAPLLKFGKFQSHDADNYTVRAANILGTADLRVEVTLDTSPSKHTVPCENEFWTTDSGVKATRDTKWAPESGGRTIVIVVSAAAGGVVLIITVIAVTVVLCVRRKKQENTGDYMTTDVFREPGQATGDYLTTDVFREPGQLADDYVNSEIFREPTSAGHQPIDASRQYERMDMTTKEPRDQPADASGQYERLDMATREPADPTNRVYLVLQP